MYTSSRRRRVHHETARRPPRDRRACRSALDPGGRGEGCSLPESSSRATPSAHHRWCPPPAAIRPFRSGREQVPRADRVLALPDDLAGLLRRMVGAPRPLTRAYQIDSDGRMRATLMSWTILKCGFKREESWHVRMPCGRSPPAETAWADAPRHRWFVPRGSGLPPIRRLRSRSGRTGLRAVSFCWSSTPKRSWRRGSRRKRKYGHCESRDSGCYTLACCPHRRWTNMLPWRDGALAWESGHG